MADFYDIRPNVRAAGSLDGVVLLDLDSGTYSSLNSVGAHLWHLLADRRSRQEILAHLTEVFDAPADQVRHDVETMLARFVDAKLLAPRRDRPAKDFSIAPAVPGKHPAAYPTVRMQSVHPADLSTTRRRFSHAIWLLRGLLALAYMDLLTRVREFPGVHRAISSIPTPETPSNPTRLWHITAAVNRAASFYYRRRWCLQRSAACAYLLKRCGFPVQLVLGVQVIPFIAHAWVEWDGQVINDNPELTRSFAVLHRV